MEAEQISLEEFNSKVALWYYDERVDSIVEDQINEALNKKS